MDEIGRIIDQLFCMLEKSKNKNYIGEDISQLDHALQCARFAFDSKSDNEVIIACLLHDIGQQLDCEQLDNNLGAKEHEIIGSLYLKKLGFSERVVKLVRNHVNAKRYLVTKNRNYLKKLSKASVGTFLQQGGYMNEDELKKFENDKDLKFNLRVREYDDKAKQLNMKVYPLESYREIIANHLTNNRDLTNNRINKELMVKTSQIN